MRPPPWFAPPASSACDNTRTSGQRLHPPLPSVNSQRMDRALTLETGTSASSPPPVDPPDPSGATSTNLSDRSASGPPDAPDALDPPEAESSQSSPIRPRKSSDAFSACVKPYLAALTRSNSAVLGRACVPATLWSNGKHTADVSCCARMYYARWAPFKQPLMAHWAGAMTHHRAVPMHLQ